MRRAIRLPQAIAPYALLRAGPALAGRLLHLPGHPDVPGLAVDRQRPGRLRADVELGDLPGGDQRVLAVDRPLDRVRRARHDPGVRAGLPARLRDRVPRRRVQEPAAVPRHRAVLHELPAADASRGRSSWPTTGSSSGRSRPSASCPTEFRLLATPAAVIAGITYNFLPFMTLPLYVALEKIDRRLLEAAEDLYAGPWRPRGTIVGAIVGRAARRRGRRGHGLRADRRWASRASSWAR